MAQHHSHHSSSSSSSPFPLIASTFQDKQEEDEEEERELELGSDEPHTPLPLTVTSRVLYMLGDITAGPAYRFTQWLELVRKRSGRNRPPGFHHRLPSYSMPSIAGEEEISDAKTNPPPEQVQEISLWDRLGKAAMLDIDSSSFAWDMLSSLHHNEHSSSTEQAEDEMNKALEVTVNSGGVVFFALFNQPQSSDVFPREAAAVIKFSSSRMSTQSERLGYEFARWLGVRTPQARVIHNFSPEWLQIKEAAEKAKVAAISEGDEVGEVTCSELLEALELSRCLFLMSYVHGSPLLESSNAFESPEYAEKTAAALGRVLMLDLIIRNEDRLPCRDLRWRGNSANLLLADKVTSTNLDEMGEFYDSAIRKLQPRMARALQNDRRSSSLDMKVESHNRKMSQGSDLSDLTESQKTSSQGLVRQASEDSVLSDLSSFHIVAIDSCVPRRPPAGKRVNDHDSYPKLVELLLNDSDYASNLLHDITCGKLGSPSEVDDNTGRDHTNPNSSVKYFRGGFRNAVRDLQGFHIFLLTLHQKLDGLLRTFLSITNKVNSGDSDREDSMTPESPRVRCPSPPSKDKFFNDNHSDLTDSELQRSAPRPAHLGNRDTTDISSPSTRENWHGRLSKGGGDHLRSFRLTTKLRDLQKFAKICDSEDSNISSIFDDGSDYIDHIESTGGKVLVHCFEGKSRSATLVLAYLMLRKNFTLAQAWNNLRRVHRRAQPNDGFARMLLELDKKLHGKVSMEWQQRKPMMKVCPVCGKNAGLSSSSLKLHLQKSHKKLSSGSVDSAMTMEIEKALEALRLTRSGSASPTPTQSSMADMDE
ncbi:Dual specificity protein phosphatase PHS1 [Linum perenne]